jgi:RNase P subunit RPR2
MTARGCQGKQAVNVVQFPRDVKLTPSCSQCRIPMVIMRAEPAPNKTEAISVTYRCTQCGLKERKMMS